MQFLLSADPRRTALVVGGQLLISLVALVEARRIRRVFSLGVGDGKLSARRVELVSDLAIPRGCGLNGLGRRRLDIWRNDPMGEWT
ncbi:hypothetical protein [Mycolicibacterium farcinogenes]|uniref:Uncharacterized protein n=1 Tax=Mycolicibacterium farcinogenes TaxID=1802 RepID=A0ACD1FQX3_MYCFR|nr:hypothetical protein [Mycolicibacterium farcinogenes]QZH69483.1 hypothetical protein K6L26_30595 [Mycolicibacterium farcinogenes]